MRLKKLELYGFKSFAQRTEIFFNEGITGVVGPNGSGKSNIGDAVRWVLGEQSAKTLRGASMQDVIFNGTQRRKPLSYCEVSLVFENEDRALPLDYAEIMVTRRVYRNGDSEYYLNRSACRLKDVIDLFQDTGIGREGYSIIGQGRIDEILSRKGEDRRQVFEEAAGIVKFRSRKEEADRKLEHTLDNLTRVDDILDELDRHLAPLEEQAKNARIYQDLSAKLKVLDLNLFLLRSDKMEDKLRSLEQELQAVGAVLEQTDQALQEKTEKRDEAQNRIAELDDKITHAHEALLDGTDAVHEVQQEAHTLEERSRNREETRKQLEEENRISGERLTELTSLLEQCGEDKIASEQKLSETEQRQLEAQQQEEVAQQEEDAKSEALESYKAAVLEAMNRHAAAMNDQTRLKTMMANMESRLAELQGEAETQQSQAESLKAAQTEASERLDAEIDTQRKLSDALTESRQKLQNAELQLAQDRKRFDQCSMQLRDMESREKLLGEMSREMEGYNNSVRTAIRYARERNIRGVHGALGQLLTVPREYETAMDMVLGAAQQNIVTEDEETAKLLIEYLRNNRLGRATFLPMSAVHAKLLSEREKDALRLPGCLGVASDLVQCEPRYRGIVENLLGRTVVADNLDHGIAIMRRGNHAFRLVTLQGDVMHSGGSMTGGSVASKSVNLFGRERELKELTEKLASGRKQLEAYRQTITEGQKTLDSKKRESEQALEDLHQQEIAVARESEHLRNAATEKEAHEKRMQENADAREQLREAIAQVTEQLQDVSGDTAKTEDNREEMEQQVAKLQKDLAEARERTAACGEEKLQATLDLSEIRHRLERIARDREQYEEEQQRLNQDRDRRAHTLQSMAAQAEEEKNRALTLQGQLAEARREQSRREEITKSLEESRGKQQKKLRELLQDVENLHESYSRDQDREHRLDLSRSRTESELKTLQDRIWNTYEITYALAEPYRKTEGFEPAEAEREVSRLNSEIRALGTVNVRAVEEYAETKARYDELAMQRTDLQKAEADLRDLIARLLEQMKTTFVENFTLLQGYFSETFQRLFGGGHAELSLMDPSDPLNCGIEINAQPPGKKLQLLTLLSGGERTLTAIAILFATLKLKPTPFCILDEIEAALDDANIGYYADYLLEFSKSTQFVVVTHRKGTMERCNSLYGVCMEEQGVSKIVSVSLEDYKE